MRDVRKMSCRWFRDNSHLLHSLTGRQTLKMKVLLAALALTTEKLLIMGNIMTADNGVVATPINGFTLDGHSEQHLMASIIKKGLSLLYLTG